MFWQQWLAQPQGKLARRYLISQGLLLIADLIVTLMKPSKGVVVFLFLFALVIAIRTLAKSVEESSGNGPKTIFKRFPPQPATGDHRTLWGRRISIRMSPIGALGEVSFSALYSSTCLHWNSFSVTVPMTHITHSVKVRIKRSHSSARFARW